MPLEIHHETGLIRVVLKGRLAEEDFVALATGIAESEQKSGEPLDRLTDTTEVSEFAITYSQMQMFASRRRQTPLRDRVRSAIVAPGPLRYGFARMFQTLNDNPQIEISIFGDNETARRWLAEKGRTMSDAQIKHLIESR